MTGLKRTLGPVTVTFYGLGTIVGAGIYVLLGSVASYTGELLAYAFLIAGAIAVFTALSYAELSARLPQCAGATVYIDAAWQRRYLSICVGWMLVFTGVVSASAIANGFVGYMNEFLAVGRVPAISGLILFLGAIAILNMQASAILIFVVTVLEVAGLVWVTYTASIAEPMAMATIAEPQMADSSLIFGVLLGSFVAFYAFIGFEDMVNIVEEVKNPKRTMPLAIILAVVIATVLYFAVATAALRVLPASELSVSDAPLSAIMQASGGGGELISLISLVAVINGALVQIIMASRVLYGMASKEMALSLFLRVSKRTHTPIPATLIVIGLILVFALMLPITRLAQLTSLVMLAIFVLVNLALLRLKSDSSVVYQGVQFPKAIPLLGALTAFSLLLFQLIPLLF